MIFDMIIGMDFLGAHDVSAYYKKNEGWRFMRRQVGDNTLMLSASNDDEVQEEQEFWAEGGEAGNDNDEEAYAW